MTTKEKIIIKKNISRAFDFLDYIVHNPEMLEKIPNHSSIIFLDDENTIVENNKTISRKKYVKVKREFEIL